jgi:HK97 gp10 family phage protein/SPP1 family predicted phage head-tail adaptor
MFAIRWSDIRPVSGREQVEGDQQQAMVTHKITLRYLEGLRPRFRITYRGRIFHIESVKNISERDKIVWTGIKSLDKAFSQLEMKAAGKATRQALRKGAKVIATDAKRRAPVDTGKLRDSIKVRAQRRSRIAIGVNAVTRDADFQGKRLFYALFVEYGTRRGQRPQPFMRPAFDANKDSVRQQILTDLWANIKTIARKNRKR